MSSVITPPKGGPGWQMILADLALILFLLALSALPAAEAESGKKPLEARGRSEDRERPAAFEAAPAQALFRPVPGGPSLSGWLASQARDPRTTLTVFVRHRAGDEAAAWTKAQSLAREAEASGVAVRMVISAGTEPDIYASLAYDTVVENKDDLRKLRSS